MDYQILFKRPFEFVAQRLGSVDVTTVYCDGTVIKHEEHFTPRNRYEFSTVNLVSNKSLEGYREESGLYVKSLTSEEISKYFKGILRAFCMRGFYEHPNPRASRVKKGIIKDPDTRIIRPFIRDIVKAGARYVFVASGGASRIVSRIAHDVHEESVMVHELVHTVEDRIDMTALRDMGLGNEAVPRLLEVLYIMTYLPEYLRDHLSNHRIEYLFSDDRLKPDYEIVFSCGESPEKISQLLDQLIISAASAFS